MTTDNGLLVIIAVLVGAMLAALFISKKALASFRKKEVVAADEASDAVSTARSASLRAAVIVGISLAVLVVLVCVAYSAPGMLLPGVAAPGIAVAAGLTASALLPAARSVPRSTRSATLAPRRFWTFGSPRLFVALLVLAAALITSAFAYAAINSGFGPALWTIAATITATTVMLTGATLLALNRVSSKPTLATPDLLDLDLRLRTLSTRMITATTASVLLGYLGAVVVPAGSSIRSMADALGSDGHPDASLSVFGPGLEILGWILVAGAIASAAVAVVLTVALSRERAVIIPSAAEVHAAGPATP